MDVFFETQNGLKFCIELGYWDTVLEIKEKIEKYQHIPVPLQTLIFEGNVLQDHLDIGKCKILHNSLVLVFVNNNQVLKKVRSPILSNSIGDIIYGEDLPLTNEDVMKIQLFLDETTEGIINGQDSLVRNNDQPPPSDAAKEIINGHQLQTERSPPSNSVNESNMNAPMKRIVVLVSRPKAAMNCVIVVNTTDHMKILRNLVQKKWRDQNRRQDGYFFVHKEKILNEDQSFEWNSVGHTDIIEIVPDPWLLSNNSLDSKKIRSKI